jgi:hypothetical protein
VETCADTHAREGLLFCETLFDLREHGHERRRPFDARFALIGECAIFDVAELFIDELQVHSLKVLQLWLADL